MSSMTEPLTILLFTGSRRLPATDAEIIAELDAFTKEHGLSTARRVLVFHGACPHRSEGRSVDAVVDGWARRRGWAVRDIRAGWFPYRHVGVTWAAGMARNAALIGEIVQLRRMLGDGVRVLGCAIPWGDRDERKSKGTWGCVDLAVAADIPMHIRRRWCQQGALL